MGCFCGAGVMVAGSLLVVLLSSLPWRANGACPRGQYHSEPQQRCINCTDCPSRGLVVLRPCDVHRDVVCIGLSSLLRDYVARPPPPPPKQPSAYSDDEHHHIRHAKSRQQEEHHRRRHAEGERWSTEAPFSGTEALVWDWQAIALTLAVFACILFFLVIALYSLHQARQWRRLKENFDADVEELSARLSLMTTTSSEKSDILNPNLGPLHEGNYLTNRCVYLEQLLNGRNENKTGSEGGNVYIQESANNGAAAAAAQTEKQHGFKT